MTASAQRFAELSTLAQLCWQSTGAADEVDHAADMISDALLTGHTVYVCGNGGSASQASHLAGELLGRYRDDRRALPCVNLCADPGVLTCIANDWEYRDVFSRQVEALGKPGDVLVCLSTSGQSQNVYDAHLVAIRKGMSVVWLTGQKAPRLIDGDAHVVRFPTKDTGHVQELTLAALHAICAHVDERLEAAEGAA